MPEVILVPTCWFCQELLSVFLLVCGCTAKANFLHGRDKSIFQVAAIHKVMLAKRRKNVQRKGDPGGIHGGSMGDPMHFQVIQPRGDAISRGRGAIFEGDPSRPLTPYIILLTGNDPIELPGRMGRTRRL